MRLTLCLGGSVLAPLGLDLACFRKAARVLKELKARGHEVLVVVGGGELARVYIRAARELGASDEVCDELGIAVTRLNARLLVSALGELAGREPASTLEAALELLQAGKIPVLGGTSPGQTTDAVAAQLAEASGSELLVYISDVDGVYTSDPKLDPNAKKLERLTAGELERIASSTKFKPGVRTIVDPLAAKLIARAGIKTLFLGKHELGRLCEVLEGAPHSGTAVTE